MAVDDRLRGDALGARQRRCPLGSGDGIHAEHPIVLSQVAPGGEVRAVGADHDVLRLDLTLGLDAADVDVADAQSVVVAYGAPDGLGDLGVGVVCRLDEEPNLRCGRTCLLQGALGQAGVPLATKTGRTGGYTLDRSMSLPPLNFTPREAAAVAVALSRSEHVLFARDARSALQKIVAAMPQRALEEARATAEKVRLLVQPAPDPAASDSPRPERRIC